MIQIGIDSFAKKYDEKKTIEISRVLIHGILHLLNYKDNEKESKT